MKRRRIHQVLPAIIMAGAAAVPVATTAEIMTHALGSGGTTALQPAAPVAALPSRSATGGATSSTLAAGTHTYQGPVVNQPYGGVQATVTVAGKRITNVVISAPQNNSVSAGINQQAVPLLQRATLQAQSAQINTVSGATLTSQAYGQSLQAALNQAQTQGNAPVASPSGSRPGNGTTMAVSVHGDD